jgi:hypothetical protein
VFEIGRTKWALDGTASGRPAQGKNKKEKSWQQQRSIATTELAAGCKAQRGVEWTVFPTKGGCKRKMKGAMHKKVSAAVAGERRKLELRGKNNQKKKKRAREKEKAEAPSCGA